MKFSKAKKTKMRKQRQQRVASYCYLGNSLDAEESRQRYTIISKMVKDDNYYLLLANENSNEVRIGKAVYSGYVKVVVLSSKKVLKYNDTFKKWIKDINHELSKYKYMVKYVLTEEGKIQCRNTDYRCDIKLPRIVHNWHTVYKQFQY